MELYLGGNVLNWMLKYGQAKKLWEQKISSVTIRARSKRYLRLNSKQV